MAAKAARSPKPDPQAWQEAERKILQSLDVAAEYAAMGVTVAGRQPNARGWLSCFAVGRAAGNEDDQPSAAINTAGEPHLLGRYKDSGGDQGRTLSLFDFAAQYGRVGDWRAARENFSIKAGVKLPSAAEVRRVDDRVKVTAWSDNLAAMWARRKLDLAAGDPDQLAELLAAAVLALKLTGADLGKWPAHLVTAPTCMMLRGYGPFLEESDLTGRVVWSHNGQLLDVPTRPGKPAAKRKMVSLGNGWLGLHGLRRLAECARDPSALRPAVVWKTEGPSDMLRLQIAIIQAGLQDSHLVITNACGAKEYPDPYVVSLLSGHTVYVVHDCDQPGQVGAVGGTSRPRGFCHDVALAGAAEVRNVVLPYPIERDHGKDLRDWLNEGHSYAELLELEAQSTVIQPAAGSPAGEAFEISPLESDDDPHRLARAFLSATGRRMIYWRAEFWEFNGRCYRKLADRELSSRLNAAIKTEFDRLNLLALQSPSDKVPPEAKKVSRAIVNNVLAALEGMCLLSESVDQNTWIDSSEAIAEGLRSWVSMANGLLKLDLLLAGGDLAECLVDHSDHWFSPFSLPYDFDEEAECPVWESFLDHNLEADPERIAILQEWAGYCLASDTKFGKFLMLEGEGVNGKSVYFAVLEALLGSVNVSHVALEKFHRPFDLTSTLGKRLNIAADCAEVDRVAEGTLKPFVTGEAMHFDRKGIPGIECRPTARLVVGTNNRPRFSDRSNGIWRRLILIPFRVEIDKKKRVLGMDDPHWWQQKGELPGIFNWAIDGLARLMTAQKFSESQVSIAAMASYRNDSNPARAFLGDHYQTTEDPTRYVLSSSIYQNYLDWCKENGHQYPMANAQFGMEIRRSFRSVLRCQCRDTEGRRVWKLLGIQTIISGDSDSEIIETGNLF